jgi:hypothetical protein
MYICVYPNDTYRKIRVTGIQGYRDTAIMSTSVVPYCRATHDRNFCSYEPHAQGSQKRTISHLAFYGAGRLIFLFTKVN